MEIIKELVLSYEFQFIIYGCIIIVFIFLDGLWMLRTFVSHFKMPPHSPVAPPLSENQPDKPALRARTNTIALVVLHVTTVSLCAYGLFRLCTDTPHILRTTPLAGGSFGSHTQSAEFEFSSPIIMGSLVTNSYPTNGTWTRHTYASFLPFGRKVTFTPEVSYAPAEKIMLYLSNIEKPYSKKWGSEFLLEANAPELSNITSSTPGHQEKDVKADSAVSFVLDKEDGAHMQWDFDIMPREAYTLERSDGNRITLRFDRPLRQATPYTIAVYRQPVIYEAATGNIRSRGDKEIVDTLSFTTAKSPLIAGYQPTGSSVLPSAPIEIIFDEPMDRDSVLQHFTIVPAASGSATWLKNETVLRFVPGNLAKATNYKVTFGKDTKSQKGGITEQDISFTFSTVGKVTVSEATPSAASSYVPADSRIIVTFDQEVNKKSAQDRFRITPGISGKFIWQGNTMMFTPDAPLVFSQNFTYSLETGIVGTHGYPSDKRYEYSFTSNPEEFILPVPYFRQQEMYTCNLAAAAGLLAYRGVSENEAKLKDAVGDAGWVGSGNPHKGYVGSYGTYWEPVERVLSGFRPVKLMDPATIEEIITEVAKGNPVMVWSQNGWSHPHEMSWTGADGTFVYAINGMHSYVVRGFRGSAAQPTHLLVNDPWRGQYAMTRADFENRWKYFKIALVVY